MSWKYLPESLRRWKHVHHVLIRNIQQDQGTQPYSELYFTLAEKNTSTTLYTSERLKAPTLNPSWENIHNNSPTSTPNHLVLTLFSRHSRLFSKNINLSSLRRLHFSDPSDLPNPLPSDTIFLHLPDGLYTLPDTFPEHVYGLGAVSVTSNSVPKELKLSEVIRQVSETIQLARKVEEVRKEIGRLSESLGRKVEESAEVQGKDLEYLRRVERAEELSRLVEEEEKLLERELLDAEQRRKGLDVVSQSIVGCLKSVIDQRNSIKACKAEQSKEIALGQDLEYRISLRKTKMLSKLRDVFPITTSASYPGVYLIRGIPIPKDFQAVTGDEDESVSSSLGYIVHLLIMISKYLAIPLRFRMVFRSSRSLVTDEVSGGTFKYPLHLKGADKERYDLGVLQLNRDLEQILKRRQVDTISSYEYRYIAENLVHFFNFELPPL